MKNKFFNYFVFLILLSGPLFILCEKDVNEPEPESGPTVAVNQTSGIPMALLLIIGLIHGMSLNCQIYLSDPYQQIIC